MVLGSILLGLSSFLYNTFAADTVSSYLERTKVVEQQVKVACDPSAQSFDPIRTEIADRLFLDSGMAQSLLKEIKDQAMAANLVLENAEDLVLKKYSNDWKSRLTAAESKVESARKKLNALSRSPASAGLRESVRGAFAEYSVLKSAGQKKTMLSDPKLAPQLQDEITKLRSQKSEELQSLAMAGGRVHSALNKAAGCYCTLRETCMDSTTLKERTDYFRSVTAYKTAKDIAEKPVEFGKSNAAK